jgi:hypothetical protein
VGDLCEEDSAVFIELWLWQCSCNGWILVFGVWSTSAEQAFVFRALGSRRLLLVRVRKGALRHFSYFSLNLLHCHPFCFEFSLSCRTFIYLTGFVCLVVFLSRIRFCASLLNDRAAFSCRIITHSVEISSASFLRGDSKKTVMGSIAQVRSCQQTILSHLEHQWQKQRPSYFSSVFTLLVLCIAGQRLKPRVTDGRITITLRTMSVYMLLGRTRTTK